MAVALVTLSVRPTDPPTRTLVRLSDAVDAKLADGLAVGAGVAVGATVGAAVGVALGAVEPRGAVAVGAAVPVGAGEGGVTSGAATANLAADAFAAYRVFQASA